MNVPANHHPDPRTLQNRFYAALPFYVAVPVLLVFLLSWASGYDTEWRAFGLGALGWLAALILRGPVAAVSMKLPKSKAQTMIVASSGVLEEGVRFGMLWLFSASLPWALSAGQGWAAIEVVYAVVSGFATLSLLSRTDEKAKQAQALLAAQGTANLHPMWGTVERMFASLFHIGATLLMVRYPWMLVILIPVHSLLNLSAVWLMKRSIVGTEIVVAVIGILVFAAGWLLK